jgi:hypothetical protein
MLLLLSSLTKLTTISRKLNRSSELLRKIKNKLQKASKLQILIWKGQLTQAISSGRTCKLKVQNKQLGVLASFSHFYPSFICHSWSKLISLPGSSTALFLKKLTVLLKSKMPTEPKCNLWLSLLGVITMFKASSKKMCSHPKTHSSNPKMLFKIKHPWSMELSPASVTRKLLTKVGSQQFSRDTSTTRQLVLVKAVLLTMLPKKGDNKYARTTWYQVLSLLTTQRCLLCWSSFHSTPCFWPFQVL